MTEATREQAQYRKAKSPIVSKYLDDHTKLFAEIAGRGFLSLPGYAYDAENGLELTAKIGLSEVNFKILSETIERELKQLGIDYNLAYVNAALVWDIEKQALLADWDEELAGIKLNMAGKEETLDRLAVEVGRRAITLLNAKVAIDIEAEGYRTTLASLDGSTASHEVQLANAKLLTAQKKLEIIPILQSILTKEGELLVKEGLKADAYALLMDAEKALAEKKSGELLPAVNELATKVENYALAITSDQIPAEAQIAGARVSEAGYRVTAASSHVSEISAETTNEGKRASLVDARNTLQETQFSAEQSLIDAEKGFVDALKEAQTAANADVLGNKVAENTQLLGDKSTIHDAKNDLNKTSAQTITNAERDSATGISNNQVRKIQGEASIKAGATVTASLNHLIG